MKVLKFGGTSVGSAQRISGIVNILTKYYQNGEEFSVVVSAFGGVTDLLIEMANLAAQGNKEYQSILDSFRERHISVCKELLSDDLLKSTSIELVENHDSLESLLRGVYLVREVSARTLDHVLSFGERNSAFIISQVLIQNGIRASYLDARQLIKTDQNFGGAAVDFARTFSNIQNYFRVNKGVHIMTGFIGSTSDDITTTLGRGGSDYSVSILGAGLDADLIEIWTDVKGVLTADPRKVTKAFTVPKLSYAEAMEMAHFGAKVIYPPTIQPALNKEIPIYIKSTFEPEFNGTLISKEGDLNGNAIKGISSIGSIALLTLQGSGLFGVPGIASRLFSALAAAEINIILITQGSSEHSISFAVSPEKAELARSVAERAFELEIERSQIIPIKVEKDLSIIAIIGENMRSSTGVSGKLFQSLGRNNINISAIAQGSSELNISVVIEKENESKALNAIHEAFFASDAHTIHLFMIGVGLIGGTLIDQIIKQSNYLLKNRNTIIKVCGLANSKKMVFNKEGINLESWKELLKLEETVITMPGFIKRMSDLNLPNSIFIDNTADNRIPDFYDSILKQGISISTPNKVAASSTYLQYQRLKNIANKKGISFSYETNVGAGLPVISVLNDLIASGDQIIKIEGVLSGSLSFIFNNLTKGTSFEAIVKEAKKLGYTEPDPREDLLGKDVRRKLLILARECGIGLEEEDVEIQELLPEVCVDAKDVSEFMKTLKEAEEFIAPTLKESAEKGERLRVIASVENGVGKINLVSVSPDNPFYGLSGSDNMIVFTTQRYNERPLVIKGPGAGAEVTAAGVFAEILKIAPNT